MLMNKSFRHFSFGKKTMFFLFMACSTIILASFLYIFTLLLASNQFYANQMTSGSDDFVYLTEAINFNSIYSILEIGPALDAAMDISGHAVGYPIFLFMAFSFIPFLQFGLLLNIITFSIAAAMATLKSNMSQKDNIYRRGLIFLMLTPGIMLTSLHLFKDIILFALTIFSLFSLQRGFIGRGIVVAFLTHIFRPYNFIIILLPYVILKFPRSSLVFLLFFGFAYLVGLNFAVDAVNNVQISIEFLQAIASRDLDSTKSNFVPTDSIVINYLLGMIRFLMLPLPWIFSPGNSEIIFYFMLYVQSIIVWTGFSLVLFYRNIALNFCLKNYYILSFTLLHASVYAVIYFGNANFRYRVYLYTIVALFIIEVLFSSNRRINNLVAK